MLRKTFIALVGVAIVAIVASTLCTFGWGDGAKILAAMFIAVGLPHIVARKSCSWWSPACSAALTVASLILVASAINYIYCHTLSVNAPLDLPFMENDSQTYYMWALHHYDGRQPLPLTTFFGVPLAMVTLWKLFGVSIIWPVAFNVLLSTTAIILGGAMAVKLTSGRTSLKASTAGAITMALLAFHGYFIGQGYVLQKEPFAYLSMALIGLAFININQGKDVKVSVAYYALGCLILALVRGRFINFAAVGVVILAISHWRTQYRSIIALAVITGITWYLSILFSSTYDMSRQLDSISGGAAMAQAFREAGEGPHGHYQTLLDQLNYFYQPCYIKVLLLPLTMSVQYIIPFLWIKGDEANWQLILIRLREAWYLCGGVAMCYYFVVSWRRKVTLGLIAWWPVICIALIAYITAGNVGRYNLPFQPMIAAIAVYTLALAHDGVHRKGIRNFFLVYLTLLLGVLFATALFTESL